MKALHFKEATHVLDKPQGLKEYGKLPVHFQKPQCVSKWKVTWRERISILIFGRVYVGVFSDSPMQPPFWIKGVRTVFKNKHNK